MRIENEVRLDFSDVLIRPKRSQLLSRKNVDLNNVYTFKHSKYKWTGIPIMASNMDGVGTFEMAKELQKHLLFTCLIKSYRPHDFIDCPVNENYFAISTGTGNEDYENLKSIIADNSNIKFICIDIANGYSDHFGEFVSKIRDEFQNHVIIAGNVVTADMTQELILRGADIVKVGIGPGSVCTTRIQTGVGYPQLSATIECADAAHGLGAHIIADGGCTCPGDVVKAFGAGADFVMLGGILAGHDEGGGEIITENFNTNRVDLIGNNFITESKRFVEFYGMSSTEAQKNKMKNYRASEGRVVKIMYKGKVEDTIQDILGGIRSACTYVGAAKLKHLSKCTTFIRVNNTHNKIFESNTIGH